MAKQVEDRIRGYGGGRRGLRENKYMIEGEEQDKTGSRT